MKDFIQSDYELWQDFKSGNRGALELIYRDNISLLINYGKKFITDTEVVADQIQNLFIELWERRAHLANTDSIKKYLLKSLRYKIIRAQSKSKYISINALHEEYKFEFVLSVEDNLVNEGLMKEEVDHLNTALANLSARQKEALFLKFYSNMSYSEIAGFMQISEQSIYNLISQSIKILQRHFKLHPQFMHINFIAILLLLF